MSFKPYDNYVRLSCTCLTRGSRGEGGGRIRGDVGEGDEGC